MIGNLTFDKASMNISYFLYTIKIIGHNNNRISRPDFVEEMATFIGVPAQRNGKENRTAYNKSKLPRYFGFVDIDVGNENTTFLVLTNRGKKLINYIGEKEDANPNERFYILHDDREKFIDLIFDSVIFDSFGKNNSGAEQSNTDVEPPKIIFKSLLDLKRATAEEIGYIIFGLNKALFNTYEDAISKIKENRAISKYDYSRQMEEWNVTNIINDFKLINIFTNENIKLLTSVKDDEIEKVFFYLNPTLSERHLSQISSLNPIYQPLRMFIYTNTNNETIKDWVNNAVLGSVSDNSYIYSYRENDKFIGEHDGNKFSPGLFEKALLKAFQNEKRNVFVLIEGTTEEQTHNLLGKYGVLLKRIDDLSDDKHGWSKESLKDNDVYNYIVENYSSFKRIAPDGEIYIPSNIQIVGTVIMDNLKNDRQFDYEFTRCLVRETKEELVEVNFDDEDRIENGKNILLYGVPGSGKSWTIEHEYCNENDKIERLVFHPDYTNADFIGQILPVVDPTDGQVTYEFTAGPFTQILYDAYRNPKQSYVLIIEEINRGNAPAIFGDIFQLLDRLVEEKSIEGIKYPIGTSEYGITNENVAKIIYGNGRRKIRIPSNLSIIGTMNTSDQNVFTLDTAFQRRWRMRLIENNFDNVRPSLANAKILDTTVSWERFCETINTIIIGNKAKLASAEDKRLGVYFIHENDLVFDDKALPEENYENLLDEYNELLKKERFKNLSDLEKSRLENIREALLQNRVFPEKVIKYLWDDAFKFNPEALFDTTDMDNLEKVIRTFVYNTGDDRFKIFKQSVQLSLIQN